MEHWAWFLATIVLPTCLPVIALAIGSFFPLDRTRYGKRTGGMSLFRDGQLGWISGAWSMGSIYEIWHVTESRSLYLNGIEILAFVLIFAGMVVSAGGAIEAREGEEPRTRFIVFSAAIAFVSAMVFYVSHATTEYIGTSRHCLESN